MGPAAITFNNMGRDVVDDTSGLSPARQTDVIVSHLTPKGQRDGQQTEEKTE